MIVILASRFDRVARELAGRWSSDHAAVVTAADLSRAGWRQYHSGHRACTAVIAGRVIDADDIAGVLTRLPAVSEPELPHIAETDRRYAAIEMTAFLVSWLSRLSCPVLNRPWPSCLAGPGWRPVQWTRTAARLGIAVRASQRHISLGANGEPVAGETERFTATVIGDLCFGPVHPLLLEQARKLARAASANLLAVHFDGDQARARFVAADLVPSLSSPELADATREYLLGGVHQ